MECDYTLVSLICLKVYQIIHVGWRAMTVLRLYIYGIERTPRSGALFRLPGVWKPL